MVGAVIAGLAGVVAGWGIATGRADPGSSSPPWPP